MKLHCAMQNCSKNGQVPDATSSIWVVPDPTDIELHMLFSTPISCCTMDDPPVARYSTNSLPTLPVPPQTTCTCHQIPIHAFYCELAISTQQHLACPGSAHLAMALYHSYCNQPNKQHSEQPHLILILPPEVRAQPQLTSHMHHKHIYDTTVPTTMSYMMEHHHNPSTTTTTPQYSPLSCG